MYGNGVMKVKHVTKWRRGFENGRADFQHVTKWRRWFKNSRADVQDDHRIGRPKASTWSTEELQEHILQNRRGIIRDLSALISPGIPPIPQ